MPVVNVDKTMAGFILRYKDSATTPSDGYGHVDAVLPGGAPFGFYPKGDEGGFWKSVHHTGVVYDYPLLSAKRPAYVDKPSAKADPCRSVLVLLDVGTRTGEKLWSFWGYLRSSAPTYRAIGCNCATYVAEGLEYAGLMSGGIEGIDTPDGLMGHFLRGKQRIFIYEGFFGFRPKEKRGEFLVEYDA
jgi:hypothetical protein